MAFESAFLDLMPHTVTLNAFSALSTDGYGLPTYASAATTVRARVVERREKLVLPDGKELVTSHVAWLATTGSITDRDKFTFESATYRIFSVARMPDQDGLHHQKVLLGR